MERVAAVARVLDLDSPVDVLLTEHGTIRRMVSVLFGLADRVEASRGFPASDVAAVLWFFREFVEHVHHRKETAVFYPFAAMAGGDRAAESVGGLIGDHDESKLLLHSLTTFWEPGELLPEERVGFAKLARTYGSRLLRHMDSEERTLFPVATRIPGDDRLRLLEEFEAITVEYAGRDWHHEIDRLERLYSK